MVSRPGPLDEKSSPVMVVVMPDVPILPNPKSRPKRKIEPNDLCQRVGALLQLRLQAHVQAASSASTDVPTLAASIRVTEGPLVSLKKLAARCLNRSVVGQVGLVS
jgi:hypothetical protein